MQQITRRPHKKKNAQTTGIIANRRDNKRVKHAHQRKLKRKLCHIAEEIYQGNFHGVKSSPLMRVNPEMVLKMIRKRYGN